MEILDHEAALAAMIDGKVIYRVSDPGRIIWSEIVNTPFGRRRVYFYFDADKCDGVPGTLEWIGKCNHLYKVYDPSDNIYFNPEE